MIKQCCSGLFLFIMGVGVGLWVAAEPLPTVAEFQMLLREAGGCLAVDGVLGPETQREWDRLTYEGVYFTIDGKDVTPI